MNYRYFGVFFLLVLTASFSGQSLSPDSAATKKPTYQTTDVDSSSIVNEIVENANDSSREASSSSSPVTDRAAPPDGTGVWPSLGWAEFYMALITALTMAILITPVRTWIAEKVKQQMEVSGRSRLKPVSLRKSKREYRKLLQNRLGKIGLMGHRDQINRQVELERAFINLRLSYEVHSTDETSLGKELRRDSLIGEEQDPLSLINKVFDGQNRMLLIKGHPGSGKSTLMKFIVMQVLYRRTRRRYQPIFMRLRELEDIPADANALIAALQAWANAARADFHPDLIQSLLRDSCIIVFDGLDEIPDVNQRAAFCQALAAFHDGYPLACLIVTTRYEGYGKNRTVDGVEADIRIDLPKVEADIQSLNYAQQKEFLDTWYNILVRADLAEVTEIEERKKQLLNYLNPDIQYDEQTIVQRRQMSTLLGSPLLLNILILLWHNQGYSFPNRGEMYSSFLSYILYNRELVKGGQLRPPLTFQDSCRVLEPLALDMQKNEKQDFATAQWIYGRLGEYMQPLRNQVTPAVYCRFLVERAHLLECPDEARLTYMFRHRTFMEYLAARELIRLCRSEADRMRMMTYLADDRWETVLRFFFSQIEDQPFREFLDYLLQDGCWKAWDKRQLQIFFGMLEEVRFVDGEHLVSKLITVGTESAQGALLRGIMQALNRKQDFELLSHLLAEDALSADESVSLANWMLDIGHGRLLPEAWRQRFAVVQNGLEVAASGRVFRNIIEDFAEYILIPGGTYRYQGSVEKTIPDLWFAKYPVTNRRYRKFIEYMQGGLVELQEILPISVFVAHLQNQIALFVGERAVETGGITPLPGKYDDDQRFNSEQQPVVGVDWFAATAYCIWLSAFDAVGNGVDLPPVNNMPYRLPEEEEWEWGSSGGTRQYPWAAELGPPTDQLANYGEMIDATTSVDSYPQGATPEGLMDMAGNVWEWQGNWFDREKSSRSLRGGSWMYSSGNLRCSVRIDRHPGLRGHDLGFRVLRRSITT